MTHEYPPRFPADYAFVIQFAHSAQFQDGTQLMTFVDEVLASLARDEAPEAVR